MSGSVKDEVHKLTLPLLALRAGVAAGVCFLTAENDPPDRFFTWYREKY